MSSCMVDRHLFSPVCLPVSALKESESAVDNFFFFFYLFFISFYFITSSFVRTHYPHPHPGGDIDYGRLQEIINKQNKIKYTASAEHRHIHEVFCLFVFFSFSPFPSFSALPPSPLPSLSSLPSTFFPHLSSLSSL